MSGNQSTSDGDGGFTMQFDFDVVEDTSYKAVQDVARLSAFGHFGQARSLSKETLETRMDAYPFAFEVLRLLFDQGDYEEMLRIAREFHKAKAFKAWSAAEQGTVRLMRAVGVAIIYKGPRDSIQGLFPGEELVRQLHLHRVANNDKLSDDQVLSAVLLLRLRYHEHEVKQPLPSDKFAILPTLCQSLPALVSILLQQSHFWAAQNVLEICFRRTKKDVHAVKLPEIWASIEWFAATESVDDEQQCWAKIAILQTFCEGCLRRKLTSVTLQPPGLNKWSWEAGMACLSRLADEMQTQSQDKSWKGSRASIRQELISFDKTIWDGVQSKEFQVQHSTFRILTDLIRRARQNNDIRLQSGIQWRVEVLANNKNPDNIPTPVGIVPAQIYKSRQALIEQSDLPKKKSLLVAMSEIWRSLNESGWQDAMSRMSSDFAAQRLESPVAKGTKRILLLGHTGAGKSTLLKTITHRYAAISHDRSCTLGIQQEDCQWKDGTPLQVIDTPGLGDPEVRDYLSLHRVCEFLKNEHESHRSIHCVFYLIDISDSRIDSGALRGAEVLKDLIGDDIWANVCFIFTRGVNKSETGRSHQVKLENQRRMVNRWHKEIFREAKAHRAKSFDLGLDYSDEAYTAQEASAQETSEPSGDDDAKETQTIDEEDLADDYPDADLVDDDYSQVQTAVEDPEADVADQIARPADCDKVDQIVTAMLRVEGPVVLECQREMCDLKRPFREIQAALRFEDQSRDGFTSRHADFARISEERRTMEIEANRTQRELSDLRQAAEANRQAQEADEKLRKAVEEEEQRKRETEKEAQRLRDLEREADAQKSKAKAEEDFRKAEALRADIEREQDRLKLQAEADRLKEKQERESQAKASEKRIKELEKQLRAERDVMEKRRTEEREAKAASEQFKKDIDTIEALAGWTPRFIVYNGTSAMLDLRVLDVVTHTPANFENAIPPGKLRAIHCPPGGYWLEGSLSIPGNGYSARGQVFNALGTFGYIAAVVAGTVLAAPGVIVGTGVTVAAGALGRWLKVTPTTPKKEASYISEGFRSTVLGDEFGSVVIASRPGHHLEATVELQMFVMEATRKAQRICLFQSGPFSVWRTKRLQILGGPSTTQSTGENGEVITQYTFQKETTLMRAESIDQFEPGEQPPE
ncbi:hypothetical protein LTR17_005618 [Elasticomyces elasticus]|nr:hypothetical protein LTR17_005618 [Elasticomyces elasticus]